MNKKELREKYTNIRHEIKNKDIKSKIITDKIINNPLYQDAEVIAFYNSMPDEVYTKDLIDYSKSIGKTILLPKVVGFDMIFFKIDENTKFVNSKLGIVEPTGGRPYSANMIDLLIVPGIVFDKECNRIGYGGGYYDRYLDFSKLPNIALSFDEQITDETIDIKDYDVKVDMIVTENNTYYKENNKKKVKK